MVRLSSEQSSLLFLSMNVDYSQRWPPGCSTLFAENGGFPAMYSLCAYRTYLYVSVYQLFTFDDPLFIYVTCGCLYIHSFFRDIFLIYSLHSSKLIFSKSFIIINLSYTC